MLLIPSAIRAKHGHHANDGKDYDAAADEYGYPNSVIIVSRLRLNNWIRYWGRRWNRHGIGLWFEWIAAAVDRVIAADKAIRSVHSGAYAGRGLNEFFDLISHRYSNLLIFSVETDFEAVEEYLTYANERTVLIVISNENATAICRIF